MRPTTRCPRLFVLCFLSLTLLAYRPAAAQEELAREFLAETNLARVDPPGYARYLERLRGWYRGNVYWMPGTTSQIVTSEGVAALDEAVRFLKKQAPVPALTWSNPLSRAARDLVLEQGSTGETGHNGKRSGGMRRRIERHASWQGRIAENIFYGPQEARLMVIQLIIDDAVPGRHHRKNIFTPSFRYAGAACGSHIEYRTVCVMDFADGVRPKE